AIRACRRCGNVAGRLGAKTPQPVVAFFRQRDGGRPSGGPVARLEPRSRGRRGVRAVRLVVRTVAARWVVRTVAARRVARVVPAQDVRGYEAEGAGDRAVPCRRTHGLFDERQVHRRARLLPAAASNRRTPSVSSLASASKATPKCGPPVN